MQLASVAFVFEVNGVVAAEAGVAEAVFLAAEFRVHPFAAQVSEGVRFDKVADVFDRAGRRDEFRARRGIDAVIAGADGGRRADTHMDFFGARVAQHPDDLTARGAADDGVIYHHDSFPAEHFFWRFELDLDAKVANRLLRFDERPADVMVANEPELQR